MITERQAKALKEILSGELTKHLVDNNIVLNVEPEINRVIDSLVTCASDEPGIFHFKNIIAFMSIFDGQRLLDIRPADLGQKFQRFCMSHKPDEYKWGIYPGLYKLIYGYFDKYDIELDSGEQRAKDIEQILNTSEVFIHVDRRWVDDINETFKPD